MEASSIDDSVRLSSALLVRGDSDAAMAGDNGAEIVPLPRPLPQPPPPPLFFLLLSLLLTLFVSSFEASP